MKYLTLFVLSLFLSACSSSPQWTSTQVIDAFKTSGLEVGKTWAMTPEDYGLAPMLAVEGTRFLIPSLGENSGGRVMSFDDPEKLDAAREYYTKAGEVSAAFASWLFVRDNILIQINRNLPEDQARAYEASLNSLK